MKKKLLLKNVLLFMSFTIFMMILYYKVIPIVNQYGMEAFEQKEFTKTKKFEEIFKGEIMRLESVLNYDKDNILNFFSESNMEYVLDIEKTTDGSMLLLSNISENKEELEQIMADWNHNKIYYQCNLNSIAQTNQEYLKHYQFHADQSKYKKLDVYIRMNDFYSNDYIKNLKDSYEEFSHHVKEWIGIGIVLIIISIVLLISITKDVSISIFKNLYVEEILVILAIIAIEGFRLMSGATVYLSSMRNEIKWVIYLVSYLVGINIYFYIVKKIKNKDSENLWLIPKIGKNIQFLYIAIIIYMFLLVITSVYDINQKMILILIYTMILLSYIKQRLEIIQINEQLKKISEGNGRIKISSDNRILKSLIQNINNIQKEMENSMAEKLKAERLKTDLITNVSHDLKTPLTSIINYIYLLQKEEIQSEKAKKYLTILKDKSNQLKNLTEDLMEASKISSGNETAKLEKLNFAEMVLQANGEFAQKFEEKKLVIVKKIEKEEMMVKLDSKKMWRVLENIYHNVYKYSLEGTRVYIELIQKESKVIFTMKNIAKDQLNISPDELMQRFVRGDKSRNSSGSGLGLSISRDLVKLQNGKFDIDIQGDLFIVKIEMEEERKNSICDE